MKKRIWLLLMLFLLAGCKAEAVKEPTKQLLWPEEAVTLFVSSDLHCRATGTAGDASIIKQMAYMDEIIDTLLDETARARPAALLLCGDLTNNGSVEEHRAVARKLEPLRQKGIPVFVTMGNHDMDRGVAPDTLKEIYKTFGYEGALSEDEDTMSYLAAVSDELWLLSLDSNAYGEKSGGGAGTVPQSTMDWIADCLDRAEKAGVMVVPFSHHNLVVHNMNGRGENYNIDNGDVLAQLLMDYGTPVYLSGHRHNSFVASMEKDGRRLDELVSDMPEAYPHRYTTVTFQQDATVDYAVPNLNVDAWAEREGRAEIRLAKFSAYTEELAADSRLESAEASLRALELPENVRADMIDYYVDFYRCYQNRRLYEERERLLREPGYALWGKYAGETVYGRWIPWLLQNQYHDAPRQTLGPYR